MSETKMKTLANCTPVEFLRQTNKIRHAAADLMQSSGVIEIRKHMPQFTGNESPAEHKELMNAQAKKNMDEILDALLETNAEKTAALFAMMCFMEPDEIENITAMDFIAPAMELLNNQAVIDFLQSLARLAQMNTGG